MEFITEAFNSWQPSDASSHDANLAAFQEPSQNKELSANGEYQNSCLGRPEGLPRTATSDEITDMGDLFSKVTLCAYRVRAAKPDH